MIAATLALTYFALAASDPASIKNGVATLADDLTQAVVQRLGPVEGRVMRVVDDDVVVDMPGLEPGFELEWLVPDGDLRDPDSLQKVGTVTRPCGIVRISSADVAWSRGVAHPYDGCANPVVSQMVRIPYRAIPLQLRAGQAEPEVRGLLDLVLAIMPDRLRQTGVVEPSAASRPDTAVVVISLAIGGNRVHAMLELQTYRPRRLHDVVYLHAVLAPESLWRDRAQSLAATTLASVSIEGRVLDVAAAEPVLLVLTEHALLRLALLDSTLTVETVLQLDTLPRRWPATRIASGRLVVLGTTVCFGSTFLESGWCETDGKLQPIDGVPLVRARDLLLARFTTGTTLLDGILRDQTGRELSDIGPFLAAEPLADGSLRVLRPDGYLERFDPLLRPVPGRQGPVGDAWAELGSDQQAKSWPVLDRTPDGITITRGDGVERSIPCTGSVVAIEPFDSDGDQVNDLAVATTAGDRSLITIVR